MNPRSAGVLGWGSWLVGCAAIAASVVVSARNPAPSTTEAFSVLDAALWGSSWVGFGLVGAVVLSRRPDNRVSWILSGLTLGVGLMLLTPAYARYGLVTAPGAVPLAQVAAWVGAWIVVPVMALVPLLVALFPTGRVSGRRMRAVVRVLVVVAVIDTVVYAVRPGPIEGDTPPFNPLGIPGARTALDAATNVLGQLIVLAAAIIVVDAVRRYRRARGVERQQFRWFVLAVAAFPLLFVAAIVLEENVLGVDAFDPVVVVFAVCGNGLAAAIYVAVTRHGLFEIDRVINRTVVYTVVTASLAGSYVGLVVLLQRVLAPVTEGSDLAVAASTLAVAAAFGPLRRRVQGFVDRRFNRRRFDAARTVAEFGATLRDEVQLGSLARDLKSVVRETVQPAQVSLWLRAPEASS
ncbi:MAG: hypothetical protein M3N57_12970 [Actinomycetota bacterium]|nr:hypothetical protein [Actinomycetota bacterium]